MRYPNCRPNEVSAAWRDDHDLGPADVDEQHVWKPITCAINELQDPALATNDRQKLIGTCNLVQWLAMLGTGIQPFEHGKPLPGRRPLAAIKN